MKRIFLSLLTIFLAASPCILFITCSKDQTGINNSVNDGSFGYNSGKVKPNAVIIGPDTRKCVCCGGYLISIDNNKPIDQYFLTYDFPGGYKPENFPVKVYIEWEKDPNACINDKIIIKKIIPVK